MQNDKCKIQSEEVNLSASLVNLMKVWQRLSDVTSLRFVAQSTSGTGWNGTGEGLVEVASPDPETITFNESGRWNSGSGKILDFRNVYRWSLRAAGDAIGLEHLRFGADNPVYLFELLQTDDETWASQSSHVCGDDLYSAILKLESDQIDLRWTVTGPNKDEDIHYWYS